ncbi:MAG TPA: AAA family ATPase [Sphingomicrobium sp.]|nr:AAA family ATPase [Sphingomicrobium sp.]
MRIRRLKLSGFKSFVEPAELRIEPGLTGVVGPNGCGKSNLLEAIRWVMGEGSPKSLRGDGMEDVIFAGTATRAARDFAEVSILIERDGGDEGGAGEGEVTRRIERGAGSAYRIDGRDVRAKDVSLLFADAATGAHSPALVSQGKVGSIIASKPTERRLLLEEAAGISGLHARRKDAEQKLRAAEANLARLSEILGDQEQRAATLRRQARAAERYRQLTDKIRVVEARLVHARWMEADAAAEQSSRDAALAEQEVERLGEQVESTRAAQQQAEALLAERRKAAADARTRGGEIAHKLATARARRDTVERRMAELERLEAASEADIGREEALKADAAAAIEQLEQERSSIERRLSDEEGHSARLAKELGELEAGSRECEAALADLLARHAAMRAERRVAQASLEAAQAHCARVEAERGKLKQQLDELGDGSQSARARDEAAVRASAAESARAAAEKSLGQAERQRSAAADARDSAESEVASARAALSAARAEHDALSRALQQGSGSAVSRLSAEPGYEQALAAALGDDVDAEIGSEGGRRWQGSAPEDGDPPLGSGLDRLADHVKAPPELERRLRQVAVTDADSGQPLAVGQRLVTLDGRMRRWDGFVAEGAGAAAAERLIRANRLAQLARNLPALESQLAESEAKRLAAAARLEELRSEGEKARGEIAAAEKEIREAERAGDSASAAMERIEAQRSALEQRFADLDPLTEAGAEAVAAAQAALVALADPATLDTQVERARETAASAGKAVADKRAEAATRARETAAARERHSAAEREQLEWRRRQKDAEARLDEARERKEQQRQEREALLEEPQALDLEVAALEQESAGSEARLAQASALEREAEEGRTTAAAAVTAASESSATAREQRAAAKARAEAQEARASEYARICVEKFECIPQRLPERMGFDPAEIRDPEAESAMLEKLAADRDRIGPVNLVAEQELAEIDEDRSRGAAEAEELGQAIHRLRGSIGSLNREGRVRLLEAFSQVNDHFRSLFTTLFEGGQAHLALVESDDPLEAGLEIMAQPPGKRLSTLTLLSGGEQALTAIALIFALFLTNPAPICVLDEVDAPLDDANVERFCDLLDRMIRETDTRYLIVTHNAVTMSRMHRLYGVTMIEKGVSRLVSVDLGGAETLLAAE